MEIEKLMQISVRRYKGRGKSIYPISLKLRGLSGVVVSSARPVLMTPLRVSTAQFTVS